MTRGHDFRDQYGHRTVSDTHKIAQATAARGSRHSVTQSLSGPSNKPRSSTATVSPLCTRIVYVRDSAPTRPGPAIDPAVGHHKQRSPRYLIDRRSDVTGDVRAALPRTQTRRQTDRQTERRLRTLAAIGADMLAADCARLLHAAWNNVQLYF